MPSKQCSKTVRPQNWQSVLIVILVVFASFPSVVEAGVIHVYSSVKDDDKHNQKIARKQLRDWDRFDTDAKVSYIREGSPQREFLVSHCPQAVKTYDQWNHHHQDASSWRVQLYKWCALSSTIIGSDAESPNRIAIWIDSDTPILNLPSEIINSTISYDHEQNIAVQSSNHHGIHSSFLRIANSNVPKKMVDLLLSTDIQVLQYDTLWMSQTLQHLIQAESTTWKFYHLQCRNHNSNHQIEWNAHFPCANGYCCTIRNESTTLFLSRHFVVPYQPLPKPMIAGDRSFLSPFESTVTVTSTMDVPESSSSPPLSFYDMLAAAGHHCLPGADDCAKCLREKGGATCKSCHSHCACFCDKLCVETPPALPVTETWTVTPPTRIRNPHRIIPKIVHQTWFEPLTPEKYPNMSRLVESFKRSGWEYRFYADDDAAAFLKKHFPPAVLEAYEALIPGAFKADLFRYCVLLIMGGVYADVDIQLESTLDQSVPPDVGFMVPIDEPGKPANRQMCLWNGLIASAPAHPFLAKAIETVVNQVRNRFTSVDVDATFCPHPELSVLHAYDTLFTAGPCLLGASINRVLGRNGQTSHVPGEVDMWNSTHQRTLIEQATSFVVIHDENGETNDRNQINVEYKLPGRTVILHQNKWDMGAHRFTFLEQNLVVAATDLPDSDDREKQTAENKQSSDQQQPQHEHYSKAHAKTGVYGVEHLYIDRKRANTSIRIMIDASLHAKKETSRLKVQTSTIE
jgi:hypothetical protein